MDRGAPLEVKAIACNIYFRMYNKSHELHVEVR